MNDRVGATGAVSWHRYRDLAIALALRELTVRYKRSLFGIGWALAEPVAMVIVYVAIFGVVLDADRGLSNYPLFTLLGLAPWMFLSSTLEQASGTLLEHSPLIRKVYFPWQLLIGAVVFSRLTTLFLCLLLAVALAAIAVANGGDVALSRLVLLPLGILLLTMMTFGVSLALAALNVVLRDVAFLVRFVLRVVFYACPIVYSLRLVPASVRPLYELNPLVGLLYFFQAAADRAVPTPGAVGLTSAVVAPMLALVGGAWLFRRLRAPVGDLL